MLEGIQENPIVVGADGNMRGGVCPMFAATARSSRSKGRNFARAWDRYGGARLPRPATEREVRALKSMLEASIERELAPVEPASDLAAAIVAHEAAVARTRAELAAAERDEAERRAAERRDEDLSAPRPSRVRPSRERVETGEKDRTSELRRRHGWSWLRPVRTMGEYEAALHEMEDEERRRLEEYRDRDLERTPAGRN
jgi:hypothetical protein